MFVPPRVSVSGTLHHEVDERERVGDDDDVRTYSVSLRLEDGVASLRLVRGSMAFDGCGRAVVAF